MEHPRPIGDGRPDGLRILQVAAVHLDLGLDVRRQIVEMAPIIATIVAHQHAAPGGHRVPAVQSHDCR